MANIQEYLRKIKSAIYGREVRDSIHDAIDAINTEVEEAYEEIDEFVQGEMDTTLTSTELPAQGKAVGDAIEDVVIAAGTQPTSEFNQIWIDEDGETEYQVPTYSEFSGLKNALNQIPDVKESIEEDVDLDISDEFGNVIVRFEDGHIKTKEFDSSELGDILNGKQDALTFDNAPTLGSSNPVTSNGIKSAIDSLSQEKQDVLIFDNEPEEGSPNVITSGGVYEALQNIDTDVDIFKVSETDGVDLDLSDDNGNVVVRFCNGGIQTKQFDGRRYTTFSSDATFIFGTSLTVSINRAFKRGDKLVLHVERGAKPWEVGALVSYYVGETKITPNNWYGDSVWLEHTVMANVDSVSAVFPANAYSERTDLSFEVSLLGDLPIEPTVVSIKKDGSGDYTNLRACLIDIGTKANDVLNPYRIEIYPGVYNVLDDYTAEEKANVRMDGSITSYTNESFVGVKLLNGMSLIGIGKPEEVIINGWLPGGTLTDDAAKRLRAQTSALNLQGSCSIENLTIIAENMRYCVHDDFGAGSGKHWKRSVKNCIFRGYAIAYTPCTTYGAGMPASGMDFEFENCDFGENAGVHTVPGLGGYKPTIHLTNCKGRSFSIGDMETSDPITAYTIYRFDNCRFMKISHNASGAVPHVKVRGIGGTPVFLQASPMLDYYTNDTFLAPRLNIAVGTAVDLSDPRFGATTNVENVYGIVVYKDDENTYIQNRGYIRTDRLGLTGFSLNDYIGLNGSSCVIVSSPADSFGKIVYIDDAGEGYMKIGGKY